MTKTCDKCGTKLLTGQMYEGDITTSLDNKIPVRGGVCWNCGHVALFTEKENIHRLMFQTATERIWKRGDLLTSPPTFNMTLPEMAQKGGIPLEFLDQHVDSFLEYLNNPEMLFRRMINDENVSFSTAEKYFGLVFRYEDGKIVVEDNRMINKA